MVIQAGRAQCTFVLLVLCRFLPGVLLVPFFAGGARMGRFCSLELMVADDERRWRVLGDGERMFGVVWLFLSLPRSAIYQRAFRPRENPRQRLFASHRGLLGR